ACQFQQSLLEPQPRWLDPANCQSGQHEASADVVACCAGAGFFFYRHASPAQLYTLSLHDALPIYERLRDRDPRSPEYPECHDPRSEEHTSELQSRGHLVCRLLLEKKNRQACRDARCEEREPGASSHDQFPEDSGAEVAGSECRAAQ